MGHLYWRSLTRRAAPSVAGREYWAVNPQVQVRFLPPDISTAVHVAKDSKDE